MFFEGLVKGLSVTIKHFVGSYLGHTGIGEQGERPDDFSLYGLFTVQYPEEKLPMYPRFRGALMHLRDAETGEPNCTGCGLCVRACPQNCLEVERAGKGKERRAAAYRYTLSDCIFCRLCVETCNFDAIEMSHEYELATEEKVIVWDLDQLLALGDEYDVHESGKVWS
jgi:NADH-quinone oxidoreductase subunit I